MTLLNRRLFALALFIFLSLTEGYGQRFYSVVFDKLPKDMQLYARDDNNLAEVPISGVIEIPGWDHMSVVTYRNNVRYGFANPLSIMEEKLPVLLILNQKLKLK